MLRNLILSAVLGASGVAANAAVIFADLPNDAGSTLGSTDTIFGAAAGLNGASNNVTLEALDPGLVWSSFSLVIDALSDTDRTGTATASFGGLAGVLVSSVDDDPAPNNAFDGQGWTYTFSFAGTLAAGDYAVTLGGLGNTVLDAGLATLSATAIPEPETYAMMLAGLGAMSFIARRRKSKA